MVDIDVCFCSDLQFLYPTLVAIKSLLINTGNTGIKIRINMIIPEKTTQKIQSKLDKYSFTKINNVTYNLIEFIPPLSLKNILVKMDNHSEIQKLKCFNIATNILNYSRFYLHKLLPSSDKILYLDGDILILGNIKSLYDTQFTNNCFFAAVNGYCDKSSYFNKQHPNVINNINNNINNNNSLFNAGVYLTKLSKWREYEIDKSLESIMLNNIKYPDKLLYYCGTEPPLNIYFNESNRIILDFCWNYIPKWRKKYPDFKKSEKNAIIVHFKGKNKPWNNKNKDKNKDKNKTKNKCSEKWKTLWKKYETRLIHCD